MTLWGCLDATQAQGCATRSSLSLKCNRDHATTVLISFLPLSLISLLSS